MVSLLIIHLFAIAVAALILLNVRKFGRNYLVEQKIFVILVKATILTIFLDMSMWFLDGKTQALVHPLYILVSLLYNVASPTVCLIWYLYVDFQVYKSRRHLHRRMLLVMVPMLINLVLAVLSPWQGYLFRIDAENLYHRGPLFLLMAAFNLFYLILAMILILRNRSRIEKRNFWSMLFFAVPPVAGCVVQSLFFGVSLVWACAAFSGLIIFVNMQNNMLYIDPLTGLFNRRHLDEFLRQNIQFGGQELLAGVMIDLDDFKAINDRCGHDVGDQALRYTAGILKKSFRAKDFIARYGGDEFLILLRVQNRNVLEQVMKRLRENLRQFNQEKLVPYELSLSVGYDCYTGTSQTEIKEFLKHIDFLMYREKQSYALRERT